MPHCNHTTTITFQALRCICSHNQHYVKSEANLLTKTLDASIGRGLTQIAKNDGWLSPSGNIGQSPLKPLPALASPLYFLYFLANIGSCTFSSCGPYGSVWLTYTHVYVISCLCGSSHSYIYVHVSVYISRFGRKSGNSGADSVVPRLSEEMNSPPYRAVACYGLGEYLFRRGCVPSE